MKVKKRKKSTRYRGSRMNRRGYKNRTKGSGNRGGYGMAGTGKRGDQRKTYVLNLYGGDYFRKSPRRGRLRVQNSLSVRSLSEQIQYLVAAEKAKKTTKGYEVHLESHKLIGKGPITVQLNVHVKSATKTARQAIEQAGGSVSTEENSE